jgi:hypothetical protein
LKQLVKKKNAVKRHRDREDLEFLNKIAPCEKKARPEGQIPVFALLESNDANLGEA